MIRILLLYVFIGCSSTNINDIPSYSLYGNDNKLHMYNKKISIDDDRHLRYYCQKHFEWEDIITVYTEDGIKYKIIQGSTK